MVVNLLIAPPLYIQPTRDAIGELADRMAGYARDLAGTLREEWTREAADRALTQARELGAEVDRADRGLARTEQSARLNPRGRLAREAHPHLRDAVTALTPGATTSEVQDAGMAVRRAVLGTDHVDRATAAAAEAGGTTEEFQRFITAYAWGGIWTRPGLDRRTRSFITLTALMARGHDEEFVMHVRAARTNGLSETEIGELVLQCAIYLGVPDANHTLRLVRTALAALPFGVMGASMLLGLGAAALVGLVNGVMIAVVRLSPFVVNSRSPSGLSTRRISTIQPCCIRSER